MTAEIKNKLRRGLALTVNESWNLYKYIETLEQESILNKIRAEIKSKIVKRPWLDFKDMERDRNDAFLEVLDIINKYKAESGDEK